MSLFRRDSDSDLERELRHARPTPREELTRGIASRIERQIPARMGLRLRVAVAVGSTVVLAAFAASVGGVGYAASSASHAVRAVTQVVTLSHPSVPKPTQRDDSKGPSQSDGKKGDGNSSNARGNDNKNNDHGSRGDDNKGKGNGDGDGDNPGKHQYHKVHMCHGHHPGDDIEVATDDVPAHLAQGDTIGRCRDRH